jgi:ABC-type Na+ efflux pump permease subunit
MRMLASKSKPTTTSKGEIAKLKKKNQVNFLSFFVSTFFFFFFFLIFFLLIINSQKNIVKN